MGLIPTNEETKVYLSRNKTKNAYKAHKMVQEDNNNNIIKEIFF